MTDLTLAEISQIEHWCAVPNIALPREDVAQLCRQLRAAMNETARLRAELARYETAISNGDLMITAQSNSASGPHGKLPCYLWPANSGNAGKGQA